MVSDAFWNCQVEDESKHNEITELLHSYFKLDPLSISESADDN